MGMAAVPFGVPAVPGIPQQGNVAAAAQMQYQAALQQQASVAAQQQGQVPMMPSQANSQVSAIPQQAGAFGATPYQGWTPEQLAAAQAQLAQAQAQQQLTQQQVGVPQGVAQLTAQGAAGFAPTAPGDVDEAAIFEQGTGQLGQQVSVGADASSAAVLAQAQQLQAGMQMGGGVPLAPGANQPQPGDAGVHPISGVPVSYYQNPLGEILCLDLGTGRPLDTDTGLPLDALQGANKLLGHNLQELVGHENAAVAAEALLDTRDPNAIQSIAHELLAGFRFGAQGAGAVDDPTLLAQGAGIGGPATSSQATSAFGVPAVAVTQAGAAPTATTAAATSMLGTAAPAISGAARAGVSAVTAAATSSASIPRFQLSATAQTQQSGTVSEGQWPGGALPASSAPTASSALTAFTGTEEDRAVALGLPPGVDVGAHLPLPDVTGLSGDQAVEAHEAARQQHISQLVEIGIPYAEAVIFAADVYGDPSDPALLTQLRDPDNPSGAGTSAASGVATPGARVDAAAVAAGGAEVAAPAEPKTSLAAQFAQQSAALGGVTGVGMPAAGTADVNQTDGTPRGSPASGFSVAPGDGLVTGSPQAAVAQGPTVPPVSAAPVPIPGPLGLNLDSRSKSATLKDTIARSKSRTGSDVTGSSDIGLSDIYGNSDLGSTQDGGSPERKRRASRAAQNNAAAATLVGPNTEEPSQSSKAYPPPGKMPVAEPAKKNEIVNVLEETNATPPKKQAPVVTGRVSTAASIVTPSPKKDVASSASSGAGNARASASGGATPSPAKVGSVQARIREMEAKRRGITVEELEAEKAATGSASTRQSRFSKNETSSATKEREQHDHEHPVSKRQSERIRTGSPVKRPSSQGSRSFGGAEDTAESPQTAAIGRASESKPAGFQPKVEKVISSAIRDDPSATGRSDFATASETTAAASQDTAAAAAVSQDPAAAAQATQIERSRQTVRTLARKHSQQLDASSGSKTGEATPTAKSRRESGAKSRRESGAKSRRASGAATTPTGAKPAGAPAQQATANHPARPHATCHGAPQGLGSRPIHRLGSQHRLQRQPPHDRQVHFARPGPLRGERVGGRHRPLR